MAHGIHNNSTLWHLWIGKCRCDGLKSRHAWFSSDAFIWSGPRYLRSIGQNYESRLLAVDQTCRNASIYIPNCHHDCFMPKGCTQKLLAGIYFDVSELTSKQAADLRRLDSLPQPWHVGFFSAILINLSMNAATGSMVTFFAESGQLQLFHCNVKTTISILRSCACIHFATVRGFQGSQANKTGKESHLYYVWRWCEPYGGWLDVSSLRWSRCDVFRKKLVWFKSM